MARWWGSSGGVVMAACAVVAGCGEQLHVRGATFDLSAHEAALAAEYRHGEEEAEGAVALVKDQQAARCNFWRKHIDDAQLAEYEHLRSWVTAKRDSVCLDSDAALAADSKRHEEEEKDKERIAQLDAYAAERAKTEETAVGATPSPLQSQTCPASWTVLAHGICYHLDRVGRFHGNPAIPRVDFSFWSPVPYKAVELHFAIFEGEERKCSDDVTMVNLAAKEQAPVSFPCTGADHAIADPSHTSVIVTIGRTFGN